MTSIDGGAVGLRRLLDVLPINASVTQLVDGQAVVRAANGLLLETTGYPEDRVLDRPLSEYQSGPTTEAVVAAIRDALRTGDPVDLRLRTEVPAGQRVFSVRFVPLPEVGDDVVLALTTDRTAQSIAEAALEESQAMANLGHWSWSPDTDVVTWSPQMWRIYGQDPDTFEATYESYLAQIHPDDVAMVTDRVREALENGTPYAFRHRIVRRDGVERTLQSFGRAVTDDDGRVLRLTGTAQDVTEQVQLEIEASELRAARRQEEQGLDLNDNVMQGLSTARVALMVGETDYAVEVLDRTMEAARALIHDLLAARIERGGGLAPGDLVRESGALEGPS